MRRGSVELAPARLARGAAAAAPAQTPGLTDRLRSARGSLHISPDRSRSGHRQIARLVAEPATQSPRGRSIVKFNTPADAERPDIRYGCVSGQVLKPACGSGAMSPFGLPMRRSPHGSRAKDSARWSPLYSALAGIVTLTGTGRIPGSSETGGMKLPPDPHYRHRFPAEIISHAVWLYHVFSLSLRDVELILAERGIVVSYETVRRWCKKFASSSPIGCAAAGRDLGTSGTWTRCLSGSRACSIIYGAPSIRMALCSTFWFSPARCRRRKAFLQTLLKGSEYVPRVIVTDKLRSYGVAQRQLLPDVEHRQSRYLNNRAENSHRPTRRRERQMQRFKSSRQAQDFLSAHAFIYGHFHPRRHQLAASAYRQSRSDAFRIWHKDTCSQHAG